MPHRKRPGEPAMLVMVVAGSPGAISLFRTRKLPKTARTFSRPVPATTPGHPQRPVGSTGWGVIGVTGSGDAHAPVGDRTNSRPVTRGGNGTSLLTSGGVSFLAFPSHGASRRASSLRCLRPTTLGRSTSMQRQGAR